MREVRINLSRMHLAAFCDERQHRLRSCVARRRRRDRARVHQRLQRSSDEAVIDEDVLFDREGRIHTFEIASPVAANARPKNQILGARRRPDWIGLDESKRVDGARESGRLTQRASRRHPAGDRQRSSASGTTTSSYVAGRRSCMASPEWRNRVFRLNWRMVRALSVGLLLVFSSAGCRTAPTQSKPASPISAPGRAAPSSERNTVQRFARGYFPGRSGQIFLVPAEGQFIVDSELPLYQFMHGSPWSYDTHAPALLLWAALRPSDDLERAHHPAGHCADARGAARDIAAAHRDGAHPAAGPRAWRGAPTGDRRLRARRRPCGLLHKYAAVMPTLSRLRAEGAWFDSTYVSSAPTVTAVGHANIGTGAEPGTHGVAVNHIFDRLQKRAQEAYANSIPAS